jgi:single-stranded DNA-binding protein
MSNNILEDKMTVGINSVVLQGSIEWPELKKTSGGKSLFKAKLKIPTTDQRSGDARETLLRITAWEDWADWLGSLPRGTVIKANTRINERSYVHEGQKRNVTDLVVDSAEIVENSTEGANFFVLEGTLQWPELKNVGETGTPLFHAKVKIPYYRADDPDTLRNSYVRITAWDELAEQLALVGDQGAVKVSGHINERKWNAPDGQTRVFTDAVVTNFTAGESAGA